VRNLVLPTGNQPGQAGRPRSDSATFFFIFLLISFHLPVALGAIADLVSTAEDRFSIFSGPPSSSNSDVESSRPALTLQRCRCQPTPFSYQLTAMTSKKPTGTAKIPSQCQSQFELPGSAPAVSLDPRDYFYPSSIQGPSVWSIRMEQELVKAVSMTKVLPATILSEEPYSAGGTISFPSQSR